MENQLAPIGNVWLAAMIDGEGTITLQRTGKRRVSTGEMGLQPIIIVSNTNQAVIEASRIYVENLGVNPYIKSQSYERLQRGWKPEFKLQVTGLTKVPKVLEAIRPYLCGKLAQADLVLEFCRSRISKGKPKGFVYDDRELEILRAIRGLNARGVRD